MRRRGRADPRGAGQAIRNELGSAATVHPAMACRFFRRRLCGAAIAYVLAGPATAACPAPGTWTTLHETIRRDVPAPAIIAEMAQRPFVLLGERHDAADHHLWQLHTIAALHGRRPDLVLGLEMFPRRVQPVLDQWVAGGLSVEEFLERSDWEAVWGLPAELYLPLLHFARIHRIPLYALNVERTLVEAVAERGWDGVPAAERAELGRPAPAPGAYRTLLLEIYAEHERERGRDPEAADRQDPAFTRFVEAQLTWDRAMAEALIAARAARPPERTGSEGPLAVGIMGSGHLRHGHGVPHQLRALGQEGIGVLLPVDAGAACTELVPGLADAVFTVPAREQTDPPGPRLGVQLRADGGGVAIAGVVPGSLAERSGLRSGDRLLAVAGRPPAGVGAVVRAIRRQPHGTWLPLAVGRDGVTVDLVVEFPPLPP